MLSHHTLHDIFYAILILWGVVILFYLLKTFFHFIDSRLFSIHFFAENSLFNFFEWNLDTDEVCVFGNDRGVRSFYRNQKTNLKEICQLLHHEDVNEFVKLIDSFKRGEIDYGGVEYRVKLPDQTRWMSLQARRIAGRKKRLISGYFQDVTEFKRDFLEEKLITHQYQALLDDGKIGFWQWDLQNATISVSSSFARILGEQSSYKQISYPASFFIDHVLDVDRTAFHRHLMDIVNGEDVEEEFVFRILDQHQTERWVSCKAVVHLRDLNNNPLSLVGIIVNVDEAQKALLKLKHAEEEQRDLAERLKTKIVEAESANRLKSMFLANMSHEIRTPLNAIIGITEALRDSSINNEQRYYMDIISHAGDNLLSLINDILDSSKIEAGELILNYQFFDLRSMILRVMDLISFRFISKDIVFSYFVDDEIEDYILGDEFRIYQVLINLLGNSGKFTDAGEVYLRVTSQSHPDGKELVFEVGDTGRGIPEDSLTRIFDAFSQVYTDNNKLIEGTGLGLSIVKRVITLMKGRVSVKSQIGNGSCFFVTVPYSRGEKRKQSEIIGGRLSSRRLAIVNAPHPHENEFVDFQLHSEKMKIDYYDQLDECLAKDYDYYLIDRKYLEDGKAAEWLSSMKDHTHIYILCSQIMGSNKDSFFHAYPFVHPLYRPFSLYKLLDRLMEAPIDYDQHSSSGKFVELIPSVLLVDDSESNLELMKLILKDKVGHIEVARNGFQAIEIFNRDKFNLILMDIQMPELDGHQAFRKIRKVENDNNLELTPIWALTAFVHQEEVDEIRKTGFDRYIAKPIKRKIFIKQLDEWWEDKNKGQL